MFALLSLVLGGGGVGVGTTEIRIQVASPPPSPQPAPVQPRGNPDLALINPYQNLKIRISR